MSLWLASHGNNSCNPRTHAEHMFLAVSLGTYELCLNLATGWFSRPFTENVHNSDLLPMPSHHSMSWHVSVTATDKSGVQVSEVGFLWGALLKAIAILESVILAALLVDD